MGIFFFMLKWVLAELYQEEYLFCIPAIFDKIGYMLFKNGTQR